MIGMKGKVFFAKLLVVGIFNGDFVSILISNGWFKFVFFLLNLKIAGKYLLNIGSSL